MEENMINVEIEETKENILDDLNAGEKAALIAVGVNAVIGFATVTYVAVKKVGPAIGKGCKKVAGAISGVFKKEKKVEEVVEDYVEVTDEVTE